MDIHGMQVQIDGESDSAKYAADYLNKLSSEESSVFFEAAKRDLVNHVCHFETPHDGEHHDVSHHLTLIHNSDGSYLLRKRIGY